MTEVTEGPPEPQILRLAAAGAHLDVSLTTVLRSRNEAAGRRTVNYAGVDLERYTLARGMPIDEPAYGIRAQPLIGMGPYDYSDQVRDPLALNTGADARWLPTAESYTEGGTWRPQSGGSIVWSSPPANAPVLDTDYSYVFGRSQVSRPALTFSDGQWMVLSTRGWAATAFTMAMVAVLKPGSGAMYGLLSSATQEVEQVSTDLGLNFRKGLVEVTMDGQLVSHESVDTLARPVMLILSLSSTAGLLYVLDRTKSSRSFSVKGLNTIDVELYLGRVSRAEDQDTTAHMDLLELDMYLDRALGWQEIEHLAAQLDSVYGVSS